MTPINPAANTEVGYLTRIKNRDVESFNVMNYEPRLKKKINRGARKSEE